MNMDSSEQSVNYALIDHVMVDIETLDTGTDAVILSIGACSVKVGELGNPDFVFYQEIHLSQADRKFDMSTVLWWVDQNSKGATLPIKGTEPLKEVLEYFNRWLVSVFDSPIIWCKGTDFDIAILTHAMNQHNIKPAWKYNNVRDCRTVFKLFPGAKEAIPENKNPHNALDDAIHQAAQLAYIARTHNFTLA